MTEPAIFARDLEKVYRVYGSPRDRLLELLLRRPRHREFRALTDVSFDVGHGEGLGIIGENGAGKSTLLKILAGVAEPSAGEVAVRGTVASILELGSGFHPEFTGRQNIRLNAAMLGLGEQEIAERTPGIIAFSELGSFIDQPVKCYSTGMTMRLGFSIATQVDPDVLIIDEALSVGDGYFQKKCMDRLLELVGQGKTLLFCSHAMYYVTAFCSRALWLRQGRVQALGPVADVVRQYESFLTAKSKPEGEEAGEEGPGAASPARITAVHLPGGNACRYGEPWSLEVEWESQDPGRQFHVGVGVNRVDEVEVLTFGTHLDALPPASGQRRYRARLEVPRMPLVKGAFTLYVFLLDERGLHIYDRRILPGAFELVAPEYRLGLVEAEHRWEVDGAARSRPEAVLASASGAV